MIKKELLDILACPETKARVVQIGEWIYSTDPKTRRRYPVRNDIPVMLLEESEIISEDDFNKAMAGAK